MNILKCQLGIHIWWPDSQMAWNGKKAIEKLRQNKKEHSAQVEKQEEMRELESKKILRKNEYFGWWRGNHKVLNASVRNIRKISSV